MSDKTRSAENLAPLAWCAATLALAWVVPAAARAAGPIEVEADTISYERQGNVIQADGDVHLKWNGSELTCRSITLEQDSQHLVAEGPLALDTDDASLRAGSVDLTLTTETGTLTDVRVELKNRSGQFGAKRIVKSLGRRYSLEEGYYTTCHVPDDGHPDWEVQSDEIEIVSDSHGELRGGLLAVRGVPLVYLPYLAFPTTTERRTGLLTPQLGHSNKRGLTYTQPHFWAIDKHRDLTSTLAVETSARLGVTETYRYRPSRRMAGEFALSYYNEEIRGAAGSDLISPLFEGRNVPLNRAMLEGWHRQQISDDTEFYANVLTVSDDLYLREIDPADDTSGEALLRRTRRYSRSDTGLIRRDGFTSYGLEAVGYQDFIRPMDTMGLFIEDARGRTLQKPLSLWSTVDGEWRGFDYGFETSLAEFWRETSTDGQRLDVVSSLSRPLTVESALSSNVWASGHVTGYRMDDREEVDVDGTVVRTLDAYPGRALIDTGVDASTTLARNFDLGGEHWSQLRNTLEPFTAFRYTSGSSTRDVPLYDGIDSMIGRTTATYGLQSRFLFRERVSANVEELGRVSIAQSYNLSEPVDDERFSDVDVAAALRPTPHVTVKSLASYDVDDADVTGAILSVALRAKRPGSTLLRDSTLGVAYYFVRGGDLESIESRASAALNDRLTVGAKLRYDFASQAFLEEAANVRIESDCHCWAIDLSVANKRNPDELQFRLLVDLIGLGSIGSSIAEQFGRVAGNAFEQDWRAGW